ncbi:MAG: spore maturation protein [bacterium]|nr:spore maturation protein [bacterium]
MNYIWSGMIIISLICAAANGCLDETAAAALDGANASVTFLISLAGAMCFWNGFLKIAENSGASGAVRRLLMPAVQLLFRDAPEKAKEYITMNMSANLLGMGNAATPMGIKAMNELDKANGGALHASKNMCMLVAINTASIQLVPSTIMAIRQAAGAAEPASVVLPILIASFGGCAAAVTAVKIFIRR